MPSIELICKDDSGTCVDKETITFSNGIRWAVIRDGIMDMIRLLERRIR